MYYKDIESSLKCPELGKRRKNVAEGEMFYCFPALFKGKIFEREIFLCFICFQFSLKEKIFERKVFLSFICFQCSLNEKRYLKDKYFCVLFVLFLALTAS